MNQDTPPSPDKGSSAGSSQPSGLGKFWAELRRRKVIRVAVTYAIAGWLIIQIAVSTFPSLYIPPWALSFVIMCVILGFPVAVILAWAFELTPEGIKTTKAAQTTRADTEEHSSHTKKRNWVAYAVGAAIPTVIFGILALFFYIRSGGDAQVSDGDKSIAVLAFANMSGDAENEYFSDGISEELLNVLAKVPNLRVPARTSSFYFKGKNMSVKEIGQALNVQYVLEGSVRKAGGQVRITAQLVKVDDGYHMWSDTFTRDLKDIFALQDEIAGLIAKQLQLELGVTPKARTVDPEAHRLLLEARYYLNQRGLNNFDRAVVLLKRALEIDPDFAQAHAAMARVWVLQALYMQLDGAEDVSEELSNVRASVNRALQLDSSLEEPYTVMAFALLVEGAMKESKEWFEKAFAISPQNPTAALWYGDYLWSIGELLASWKEFEKAREYDPMSFIIYFGSGYIAKALGRPKEALDFFNRCDYLRPGGFIPAKGQNSAILWKFGSSEEAIELARKVRQSWPQRPRFVADADAVWVLQQAGLQDEVSEYTEMLFSELPERSYQRGFVLASIGRFEEALPYLENTPILIKFLVAFDPLFDPYRQDQRFKELIETLEWTEAYERGLANIEKAKARR